MALNGNKHPDIQAAELYDRMYDEARGMQASNEVLETALCMLMGAYMGMQCQTDSEAAMMSKRLGQRTFDYYERSKKISSDRREAEKQKIITDGAE